MEQERQIYYIATEYGATYITYDPVRCEATLRGGKRVTITLGRLADFIHTARLFGMKAGKV